jgi:hypothetical protein
MPERLIFSEDYAVFGETHLSILFAFEGFKVGLFLETGL